MIQIESIAGYRVLRTLGEGGMGRVYEALQTEPVRRHVALKVLRRGGEDAVAARFEAERQALAMMDHPGIAKVFDAGVTEEGQQWLAMELVSGRAMTEYADAANLAVADRVALFTQVCQAVQHAHQKGVIHRDLKPSNILVGDGDDGPAPKVIDFGVAKALDLRLTEETLVTQFGAVIGTPAYMSPEQAEGTALDIDTRADVYSLGVMLYELLVGCLPVDPAETGYPGFIAYLKDPDTGPPTPRDRFTTLDPERQLGAAAARETNPARLRERLAGDLGWIVMTALEKERGRRYESAGALAADLERYLRREPVTARPPSRGYQLRKFVSRHRLGVTAAAAVALALTLGAAAATAGMMRAQREAAVAQREARTAQRVSEFLATLFNEASPQQSRGREVTVREVLDRGAAQVETELADEPLVQARLMRAIGQAYQGLGLFDRARPLMAGALDRAEQHANDPLETAGLQHDLGYLLTFLSEFEAADSLLRASLAAFEREEGHGADWTTTVVANLAFNRLRWGHGVAEADSLLAANRPAQVAGLGETHPKVAIASYLRCWTLRELGRRMAADSACAASLDLVERSLGSDAPQVVYNTLAVGHTRRAIGQWQGAREAYRAAAALNRRLHPDGHPETAYALQGTAIAFREEGRPDSSLVYALQSVDLLRRTLGPSSTQLAEGMESLARTLVQLRRFDEAEALYGDLLAIDSVRIGVESQRYATHLAGLGELRLARGDFESAHTIQQRSLATMERVVPPESPRLMVARTWAGEAARRAGDAETAERLLRVALQRTEESPDDFPLERSWIQTTLALALIDQGAPEEAGEHARESRVTLDRVLGNEHWRAAWALAVEGLCAVRSGRIQEGLGALETGLMRLEAALPPGDLHRRDAQRWLDAARAQSQLT